VIGFFVLLLLFAGVLMSLQIWRFGGVTGFISYGDYSNINGTYDDISPPSGKYLGLALVVFIFILIVAFVVRFFKGHQEKSMHADNGHYGRRIRFPIN